MTLSEAKICIKDNIRIGFHSAGIDDVLFIEKLLMENGMTWRGRRFKQGMCIDWDISDRRFISGIYIYINYDWSEPKRMSYGVGPSIQDIKTIEVSNYTRSQLKSIFIHEPSYKPKKIKRVI